MKVWGKRVFLFIAVNLLVITSLTILMQVFGINQAYLSNAGIDYQSLAIICLVWGMGGAFISLALSRVMAKWMMGVKVIDPQTHDQNARALLEMVHNLARAAGLPKMPQVGIYESQEVNAFATGPTKSRALVAVSSGLLARMRQDEIEGVLGHEISHVANGDMVTMTLVQGVVNAFVMFLARVVAFAVVQALRGERERGNGMSGLVYPITVFVLQIVFMVFGSVVVGWFSRLREYRADQGGARLAGREKMIAALESLKRMQALVDPNPQPAIAAFKISGRRTGFRALFATHPALEDRIMRLQTSTAF